MVMSLYDWFAEEPEAGASTGHLALDHAAQWFYHTHGVHEADDIANAAPLCSRQYLLGGAPDGKSESKR